MQQTSPTTGRPRPTTAPPTSRKPTRRPGPVRAWLQDHPWAWHGLTCLKVVASFVAPVVLLSLLAAGLGYVRLKHGPISLTSIAPRVEAGIDSGLNGFRSRIDDVVIALSPQGGLELRLINLRLTDAGGEAVASAPLAAVELSHGALWSMQVVPERIYLIEPLILLSYSEQDGLSLRFSQQPGSGDGGAAAGAPGTGAAGTPGEAPAGAAPVAGPSRGDAPLTRRVDLVHELAELSARARSGADATYALREIGLRDATVELDFRGQSSRWRVPEAAVDLQHSKKRSIISGAARIDSERGPWVLSFRTTDLERRQTLRLSTSVRDLVPSVLAKAIPQLSLLGTLDMPVALDTTLQLASTGDIQEASLAIEVSRGQVHLPQVTGAPLIVDAGLLRLAYSGADKTVTMAPSTLRWGDSHMTMIGTATGEDREDGGTAWTFDLSCADGLLAAEEFDVAGIKVDSFVARGRVVPRTGELSIAEFALAAGGAEISANGDIRTGGDKPSTRIDGRMTPASLATLKALWPRAVAPAARTFVGTHVTRGKLASATVKVVGGAPATGGAAGTVADGERMSLAVEVSDLQLLAAPGTPPIEAPRALIRLENNALEVTVPDAAVVAAPSRQATLKGVRFTAVDVASDNPIGELAFRITAPVGTLLEAARGQKVDLLAGLDLPPDAVEGALDGQFKITMPLAGEPKLSQIKASGKARVTDVRSKAKIDDFDVQGGSLNIEATETAVEASGEILINGVLAKLNGQHIFSAPPELQPPLRITTTLDNSDRNHLDLDINDIVIGDIGVEMTVSQSAGAAPKIHVRTDLTNADMLMKEIAWHKPQGRAVFAEFDLAKVREDRLELQNFKMVGDQIAIEGWMAMGPDKRMHEYYFPDFSLNVVSRLEVQGRLQSNNVWKVKARGPTYDGKDFFRTFFSPGQIDEQRPKARRPAAGIDVDAEIDTVLGYSGVSLRGVKVAMSTRAHELVSIDAKGTLDGGKPVAVLMKPTPGAPRKLFADSTDAGQAFKLVNFYPNVVGGRVRLEVDLDGKGAADKTGILWVDDFKILGDPIASELAASAGESPGRREVVREVTEFNQMRVPFSVGHDQFVLSDSYLRGPIVGATISGNVDYKEQRVNLAGSYIPLQGINAILCGIPLIGDIFTGPRCEGMFGITYAVRGPMANPQVEINPLALLGPGAFRGLFQLSNPSTQVVPREDKTSDAPVEKRVRASSSAVSGGEPRESKAEAGDSKIDGWASPPAGDSKEQ